jgi:hypothetical protein
MLLKYKMIFFLPHFPTGRRDGLGRRVGGVAGSFDFSFLCKTDQTFGMTLQFGWKKKFFIKYL